VLTVRETGRLLRAIGAEGSKAPREGAVDGLVAILHAFGFGGPVRAPHGWRGRVCGDANRDDARVRIADGGGALRAMLLEWRGSVPLRERIAGLCRTIGRESPAALWIVIAHDLPRGTLLIAVPAPGGGGPTAALELELRELRESDVETVAALAAVRHESDGVRHLRWTEVLGRDTLTRRFYRDFASCVSELAETAEGRATPAERREIAVLHASRLLFLAFLEAKGWLARDRAFLRHALEARCGGRGAHRRFLEPLFFGTLNTPPRRRADAARAFGQVPFLNGGLFSRTPLESRCRHLQFTDGALGRLVGDLLGRYRVTARESRDSWREAAVDPEMLGRAFESLMAGDARRTGGVFYTPQPLIARITGRALDAALSACGGASCSLETIRVMDPACGSGAFLVYALEEIAARRAAAGDRRDIATIRRDVLSRSVFGVDRDPTAVWLCQLRLWLSVVVEDERDEGARIAPLPNLDRNIREGDALAGDAFAGDAIAGAGVVATSPLDSLRLRYARSSGVRKRTLGRLLDRAERAQAVRRAEFALACDAATRREILTALRSRDLFAERRPPDAMLQRRLDGLRLAVRTHRREVRRLRDGSALPFAFGTHFPDLAHTGGVELVIGNPPWVRAHRIPPSERSDLRARFESFRDAAWRSGAAAAAAGRGFASQADLAALFVERAVQLARAGGVIALLVPTKLWSALAGGGIRQYLAREAPVLSLDVWPEGDGGFDAVVYPSALLARRSSQASDGVTMTRHGSSGTTTWESPRAHLALEASDGAPWLILPPDARAAFHALSTAGVPLGETPFGRPLLGVKTGCNAAFVVPRATVTDLVEPRLLRPVLRGEDLRPFARPVAERPHAIIWTHGDDGTPLAVLPAGARQRLTGWRRTLERRADARGARWWSLFRTEAARHDVARVCWCDIGREPRALVLPPGDASVPLNSCYVVRAPSLLDAHALAALLNSRIAAAWLGAIAEPARGGYRRFLGWTCARFPLPRDWRHARARLGPIGARAARGRLPEVAELDAQVCEAYGLSPATLAPLLAWDRA